MQIIFLLRNRHNSFSSVRPLKLNLGLDIIWCWGRAGISDNLSSFPLLSFLCQFFGVQGCVFFAPHLSSWMLQSQETAPLSPSCLQSFLDHWHGKKALVRFGEDCCRSLTLCVAWGRSFALGRRCAPHDAFWSPCPSLVFSSSLSRAPGSALHFHYPALLSALVWCFRAIREITHQAR